MIIIEHTDKERYYESCIRFWKLVDESNLYIKIRNVINCVFYWYDSNSTPTFNIFLRESCCNKKSFLFSYPSK
jgi:hypothetical protein